MTDDSPTPLHELCHSCTRPITKGQPYRDVNTPDGLRPVHDACLQSGRGELGRRLTDVLADEAAVQLPASLVRSPAMADCKNDAAPSEQLDDPTPFPSCPSPALGEPAGYAHERAAAHELARSSGQGSGAIRSFDDEQRERDVQAAIARFAYQPPRDEYERARYTALTAAYASLAEQIVQLVPAGRDRESALQFLQASRGFANGGIALAGTRGA